MTVIARATKKKQFDIPEEGPQWATLREVRDLGEVSTSSGLKQKVLFVGRPTRSIKRAPP